MRRRSRAFTLVEALVYAALLLLMVGVLYAVIVAGLRYFQLIGDSAAAEQDALKAANEVLRALDGSAGATVMVDAAGIRFVSAERADGSAFQHNADGKVLWQKVVCFYQGQAAGQPALLRKETTLIPSAQLPDTLPTPAQMSADAALAPAVVERGVTAVFGTADGRVQVSVTAARASFRPCTATLECEVEPRQ